MMGTARNLGEPNMMIKFPCPNRLKLDFFLIYARVFIYNSITNGAKAQLKMKVFSFELSTLVFKHLGYVFLNKHINK